jgi:hypothetical protein
MLGQLVCAYEIALQQHQDRMRQAEQRRRTGEVEPDGAARVTMSPITAVARLFATLARMTKVSVGDHA